MKVWSSPLPHAGEGAIREFGDRREGNRNYAGVSPAIFAAPIASEYRLARDTFGLDEGALAGLAQASVTASFADADTKTALRRAIDRWLGETRHTDH